jgi:hypothetical protein
MSLTAEKPPKIGTEITVRISLTFQEAPDVHTLLAMTPVRKRGMLVRLALERYIKETGHPSGDVEQQISAISHWLRSREPGDTTRTGEVQPPVRGIAQHIVPPLRTESIQSSIADAPDQASISADASPSLNRWLHT